MIKSLKVFLNNIKILFEILIILIINTYKAKFVLTISLRVVFFLKILFQVDLFLNFINSFHGFKSWLSNFSKQKKISLTILL